MYGVYVCAYINIMSHCLFTASLTGDYERTGEEELPLIKEETTPTLEQQAPEYDQTFSPEVSGL